MTLSDDQIGIEAALDLASWTAGVRQMTSDAGTIDAALKQVASAANEAETALNAIGGGSLKVEVAVMADTSQAVTDIKTLDDYAPSVEVATNLEQTDITTLNNLDAATVTPEIKPTLDDSAIRPITSLGSDTIAPKVSPTLEGGDAEALKQMTGMETLNLSLVIVGPGVGVLQQAYELLTANQEAMAILEARTGTLFEGADTALNNIYVATGVGRDEIAKTLAAAQGLGIDPTQIEGASQSALAFAAIWDEDVSAALNAANQLVTTGLAPDFQSAFDIIQTGFEEGLNKGDDFLDTIKEYSTTFSGLGMTASESLSVIKTGLEGGFDVSDRIADLFREFNIRAANPDETAAQDALKLLGLGDEAAAFQAGKITGAEFFKGVVGALQEQDSGTQQTLGASIFGSQFEDFDASTVFSIDPVTTFFDEIDGRAAASSAEFSNTLGSTVSTFFRDVQVEAETFLSSDQLGLKAKLDTLKTQLTDTMAALQGGADLGEAIEVGFHVVGVQEAMDRLESIAGNLAIGFLDSVAAIQSFLGQGEGADTTRKEVARLGEGQLTFDLKLAENQEEITAAIQTAVARGVDMETIATSAGTAIDELLAEGSVGAAQKLIEEIQFQGAGFTLSPEIDPLFGPGVMMQNSLNTWIANRDLDMINQAISAGIVVAPEGIDVSDLQTQVDTAVATLTDQFDSALATGDLDLATTIANQLGDPALIEQINTLSEALDGVNTTDVDTMVSDLVKAKDDTITAATDMAAGVTPEVDKIGKAFTDADSAVVTAVSGNSIVPQLLLLLATATATLPLTGSYFGSLAVAAEDNLSVVDSWSQVAVDSLMGFGNTLPILDSLLAKLSSVAAAASNTTALVNGLPSSPPSVGGQPVPEMATGGIGSGLFSAGEEGKEYISADTQVAVLNNQSTGAIDRAVQSVLGGMGVGGGTTKNVNVYLNQIYNVQSQAQAVNAAQATANQVRGFW